MNGVVVGDFLYLFGGRTVKQTEFFEDLLVLDLICFDWFVAKVDNKIHKVQIEYATFNYANKSFWVSGGYFYGPKQDIIRIQLVDKKHESLFFEK